MRPFTQNVEHHEENIMNEKIYFFVASLMGYVYCDDGSGKMVKIVVLLDDLSFNGNIDGIMF